LNKAIYLNHIKAIRYFLKSNALLCLSIKYCFKSIILPVILLTPITFYSFANEPITPIVKKYNIDNKKFELGQMLFKDTRLSGNQKTSCYSCHDIKSGGADGLKTPTNLTLNSTTILNINKNYYIGWRGKYTQLKPHLEMIFANPKVMATNWELTIHELKSDTSYPELFNYLYADGISKESVIDSVLYYESNLVIPSKFDEFLLGNVDAISLSAKQGYNKFKDYGCASCHQGSNVGGNVFQKLGVIVPYKGIKGKYKAEKLRVPSLRNVAQTAPYLHNGSIDSLKDVIKIMAKHQLGQTLAEKEVDQIADFLTSLNSIPE